MTEPPLPDPPFDLEAPGTRVFTVGDAVRGNRINRFARTLRSADNRAAFVEDERGAMEAAGLRDGEIELILRRDWTALLEAGGHLQSMLVIAAALGGSIWDIGAHHVGCSAEALVEACPRSVTGLPGSMRVEP